MIHRPQGTQSMILIEPDAAFRRQLTQFFASSYTVNSFASGQDALLTTDVPDIVVAEVALKGHSIFEFLYEYRTYADCQNVPVVLYTSVQIKDEILSSRSWKQLNVHYAYKPDISVSQLNQKLAVLLAGNDGSTENNSATN